jgi:hypothetical protein
MFLPKRHRLLHPSLGLDISRSLWCRSSLPFQPTCAFELGYFAVNAGETPPPIQFQHINANYAGFQVANIETAYARAKEHGAITVSGGGIFLTTSGARC